MTRFQWKGQAETSWRLFRTKVARVRGTISEEMLELHVVGGMELFGEASLANKNRDGSPQSWEALSAQIEEYFSLSRNQRIVAGSASYMQGPVPMDLGAVQERGRPKEDKRAMAKGRSAMATA